MVPAKAFDVALVQKAKPEAPTLMPLTSQEILMLILCRACQPFSWTSHAGQMALKLSLEGFLLTFPQ